jgi:hypothetical protein
MATRAQNPRDVVIANAVLGAAVVGGAWIAMRCPVVRRLAWRGVKFALVTWLPTYVAGQVREAWQSAAPPAGHPAPETTSRPAIAALAPPARR